MKKRFLLMGVAAALVMATVVGGTLAADQVSGDQAVAAPLAATNLRIDLEGGNVLQPQVFDLDQQEPGPYMPGDTILLQTGEQPGIYTVKNTGSVDAYIRVTVNKYWMQENEKALQLDSSLLTAQLLDHSNWIESSTEDLFGQNTTGETQVFYYKHPLKVNAAAEALLGSLQLAGSVGNEYQNCGIRLEAVADGVQFAGAAHNDVNQQGILSSWGVLAELDADGSILSITQ